jgi:hypothetical protein
MLRLLVVAEDPARERDMVWRAEAAREELSSVPEVEVVVSPMLQDGGLSRGMHQVPA